jgi:predicted nucleic acid-binding protein
MRLVVADTGPLNYLVLIDAIELLPKLFEKVFTPAAVQAELLHPDAPSIVRAWATQPPPWLEVRPATFAIDNPAWRALDAGEREALALARLLGAELVLMDDRAGAAVAQQQGLTVTGTLGVLDLAGQRGLVDLADAFRPAQCDVLPLPAGNHGCAAGIASQGGRRMTDGRALIIMPSTTSTGRTIGRPSSSRRAGNR